MVYKILFLSRGHTILLNKEFNQGSHFLQLKHYKMLIFTDHSLCCYFTLNFLQLSSVRFFVENQNEKGTEPHGESAYSLKVQTLKCKNFEKNHQVHFTQTLKLFQKSF